MAVDDELSWLTPIASPVWSDRFPPIGQRLGSLQAELEASKYPNIPLAPDFARADSVHASQIPYFFTDLTVPPAPPLSWEPVYEKLPPAHFHAHARTPHLWPFFFWAQNVGDIRITHIATEALEKPDGQVVYVTQVSAEALEKVSPAGQLRVTHVIMEFLHPFECGVPEIPRFIPSPCPPQVVPTGDAVETAGLACVVPGD
jgi:hypothetical protein